MSTQTPVVVSTQDSLPPPAGAAGNAPSFAEPGRIDLFDVILVMARNLKLLVVAPIVAGALAFGVASFLPKTYTSVATLKLDDAGARTADAYVRSPVVLDVVLKAFPDLPGATPEERRRHLNETIRWEVASGESRRTAAIFYLLVEDRIPARAQAVATALLDTWLELTKPRPDARVRLEEQLTRTQAQLKSADELLRSLQSQAPSLVIPNSLAGELATSLTKLMERRDHLTEMMVKIRFELTGVSRDFILAPPSLPVEHTWPRRGPIAIRAAIATGIIALLFVFLRYIVGIASTAPRTAGKMERIRNALRPRWWRSLRTERA
jgi:hypothetical protein